MARDPFDEGQGTLLSEPRRLAIASWLRAAADVLALRDWRIEVSPFQAPRTMVACSHLRDDSELTWIAVGRDFLEETPDGQRTTLTHELLHCHFQPVTRMVEKLLEAELGTRAEAIIDAVIMRVEERAIDRLASGLATLLPPFSLDDPAHVVVEAAL